MLSVIMVSLFSIHQRYKIYSLKVRFNDIIAQLETERKKARKIYNKTKLINLRKNRPMARLHVNAMETQEETRGNAKVIFFLLLTVVSPIAYYIIKNYSNNIEIILGIMTFVFSVPTFSKDKYSAKKIIASFLVGFLSICSYISLQTFILPTLLNNPFYLVLFYEIYQTFTYGVLCSGIFLIALSLWYISKDLSEVLKLILNDFKKSIEKEKKEHEKELRQGAANIRND
jgi:hypothetical protein